jgi:Uma2 family endonuclease
VSHQQLLGRLYLAIARFLEGKTCQVLLAPVDLFLPSSPDQDDDDVDTVVQPDVIVVCDTGKVRERGVRGAPDWVVEMLAPSTTRKDVSIKLELYEEQGVREYWIVDPGNRCVHVYARDDAGRYGEAALDDERDRIAAATCPGLVVDLMDLFSAVRK